ncbi:hypothetical protein SAY86_023846 [Trapa natans]|uniref:FRIGIDA-like protein n=1 Tax=Trapa natans TaxID=22666 RepID=A0AAN7RAL4_TRANT|nr:hypothetical protein SAY86_023846 [Trapa natans]
MEIETLTDRVQKFADELEAEKAILCTCKELFMNLSDHFKARKASLSMRSQSVEVKLQSLESSFRQTLESLSEREDSIPLCESEAVKQVQQRKQAAISEIEKPVSGDLGLPETLRSISMRMDSLGLIKFLILKRREPALLKAELPASINEAIDPPRLVLNAVEDFLDSKAAKTGTMDKRWAVGLLVHALFPDLKSDLCAKSEENVDLRPKFAKSVVDRALRVLERWKGQVGTSEDNSDFGRFGPLEALMFLEMVVGFGLKSQFDEVFLKKMVVEFSSRREMAKLVPCLGLGEKLAGEYFRAFTILHY